MRDEEREARAQKSKRPRGLEPESDAALSHDQDAALHATVEAVEASRAPSLKPLDAGSKHDSPHARPNLLLMPEPAVDTAFDSVLGLLREFLQSRMQSVPPSCTVAELEIEAKFGQIIDKRTQSRLYLPIANESVLIGAQQASLSNRSEFRFQSNMSPQLHAHFNRLFNDRVAVDRRLSYRRRLEIDQFYSSQACSSTGSSSKIRATLDATTMKLLTVMTKERLADLLIYFPWSPCDVRLSVSLEKQMQGLPGDGQVSPPQPIYTRRKNRLSYTLDGTFSYDLTQVDSSSEGRSHELELEVLHLSAEPKHIEWMACSLWRNIQQICQLAKQIPK